MHFCGKLGERKIVHVTIGRPIRIVHVTIGRPIRKGALGPPLLRLLDLKIPSVYCKEILVYNEQFITVRNNICGKVMFSRACVKNSVHREGGCLPHSMLSPRENPPGRHPLPSEQTIPTPRWPLQRTVRILLERILVSKDAKSKRILILTLTEPISRNAAKG